MQLRPYQNEAHDAIIASWAEYDKVLIVLATGTGKTILFSKITETVVKQCQRVLILAHRGELLEQARDKMQQATGLKCSLEKADSYCMERDQRWYMVTVGSVQTMMNEERLKTFPDNYFDCIIVDEAHHVLADSYQRILDYFSKAKELGVTATPDRGDMRNLGNHYQDVVYEYPLPQAIADGYLVPIKAQTIPIQIEIATTSGEYSLKFCQTALDPYLESICKDMGVRCQGRRTIVFTPLIATSLKMKEMLLKENLRVAEINGESQDRKEILEDWEQGKYDVLLNSMLLTEGWDSTIVDTVMVLRFTKIPSLYEQMVGRGTRIHGCDINIPGLTAVERKERIAKSSKPYLLLFDYLFHSERLSLCRPASLYSDDEYVQSRITEVLSEEDDALNLELLTEEAESDAIADREEALAKKLEEMRRKKGKLVDPLQYEMSVQAEDLANYQPTFGWEIEPPTDEQKKILEKNGIYPGEIESKGKASKLIDSIQKRQSLGLASAKQIRFLEKRGFKHVGSWKFETARKLTNRIAGNGWKIPFGIDPKTYQP